MGEVNVNDFGRFKFIERYKNGKIYKRYYDLYGTITKIDGDKVEIKDNDTNHVYKVFKKDIEYFHKRFWRMYNKRRIENKTVI